MRTVFVAGASSDIGIAVCRRYIDAGWRVIGHFRTPRPELDALRSGKKLELLCVDFAETSELKTMLARNDRGLMSADALINLAAAVPACDFLSATPELIHSTLATNLLPGIMLMQALGPAMAERGWGRIVHASSIGVKFGGGTDSFLYSLSKHALEFIPSAARAWASANVLVNVLRVGVTNTRAHGQFPDKCMADRAARIPAKRMATTDEMAELLYWLGSEHNGFIAGEVIDAAGGE